MIPVEKRIRIRGISVRKGGSCEQLPLAWLTPEATQNSASISDLGKSNAPSKGDLIETDSCLKQELEVKVTHVIEQLLQNVLKTADFK